MVKTIGAIAGIITAVASGYTAYMKYVHHPTPPPITIESGHAEFYKLNYSEQIDICQPYIEKHRSEWFNSWRSELKAMDAPNQPASDEIARPNDENASGQSIANLVSAVLNHTKMVGDANIGMNLYECITPPNFPGDPTSDAAYLNSYNLGMNSLIGNGNRKPLAEPVVVRESQVYYSGQFAGLPADDLPSKVVEVVFGMGTAGEERRQLGFTMMDGYNDDVHLWVETVQILPGDKRWVEDVEEFWGY